MDETRIEPLTAKHQRGTFDCGTSPLNSFIRQHAPVNHERGVSRVIPLQDDPFHLYLPMATVRAMFAQATGPPDAPR
jgi:hypothetical protein